VTETKNVYHEGVPATDKMPDVQKALELNEREKGYEKLIKDSFVEDYVAYIFSDHTSDYNEYIDKVKRYVSYKCKDVTTAQLRNVYARIQKAPTPFALQMLRPKIAYVAGRTEVYQLKVVMFLLEQLIVRVDGPEKLDRFKAFYEAIVAYHKYYHGRRQT